MPSFVTATGHRNFATSAPGESRFEDRMSASAVAGSQIWYDYFFRIEEFNPNPPNWRTWIDLFLLDAVIGESLRTQPDDLSWLIHRRWVPDEAGHEFKFSCYCSFDAANRLDQSIRNLQAFQLYEKQLATYSRRARYECVPGSALFPRGEAWWPTEIPAPWTGFICGASRCLLELIIEVKRGPRLPCAPPVMHDVKSIEQFYGQIEYMVDSVWQGYGQHAFLHHLNAVFGYLPLICTPAGRRDAMLISF
jgi:hypothetical protein